jgi:glycosyltransferase involved in cell wall biosynthesis
LVVDAASATVTLPSGEVSGPTSTGLLKLISDTLACSFRIQMGVVLLDGGGDPPAVREQHGYRCAGGRQRGMDLRQADRPSEVRRHPAGCDPPQDRARVTVHDLGYEHFPQAHPWRQRQYLRWSTRRHARLASHIIADSQATKDDLIRFYNADPTRIHVVYLAPDPSLQPEENEGWVQYVRASYGIPGYAEYILHIGTIHPRKNLTRLVEAFARVRQQLPERKLHLVLVGGMGHEGHKLRHKVQEMGLAPYVRFTGYARVHDIPSLYTGAACYVLPSLNEGFGFPALEAQICGVPLLCARSSSLPEVAGEGALYFDPLSVDELAAALRRLLVEPELRAELVAKGRENVQRFSWRKTARQTLEVLEMAAHDRAS